MTHLRRAAHLEIEDAFGQPARPARQPRRRRALRRIGVGLALVAIAAVISYQRLTDPERIRRLCLQHVERLSSGRVTIQHASFSLSSGLTLRGVAVWNASTASPRNDAPYESDVVRCPELRLKLDLWRLLSNRLVVREVLLCEPMCTLVRDADTQEYNVAGLFRGPKRPRPENADELPTVRVESGRVRLLSRARVTDRAPHIDLAEELRLDILAMPLPDNEPAYEITWSGGAHRQASGKTRLDLSSMSLTDLGGGLPWLSLQSAVLAAASAFPDLQGWAAALDLSGEIHIRDYAAPRRPQASGVPQVSRPARYTVGGSSSWNAPAPPASTGTSAPARNAFGKDLRVVFEIANAQLSLPYDDADRQRAPRDRFLRFDQLHGKLTLDVDGIAADLSGRLRGSPCTIAGRLAGRPANAAELRGLGASLRVTVHDVWLPRPSLVSEADASESGLTHASHRICSFYKDFDPHGRVGLDFVLSKAPGVESPLRLERGTLTALGCDASYRHFPYRLSGLTGRIEYLPDGFHVRDLTDGSGDVTIDAWIAEARWTSAAKVRVTGRGVPLDDKLHGALSSRYVRIWDQFNLQGMADIEVNMSRGDPHPRTTDEAGAQASSPELVPAPWTTQIESRMIDAVAEWNGFPYFFHSLTGRVSIGRDEIAVSGLSGRRGPTSLRVDGAARLDATGLCDLDLELTALGVPFDTALSRALPEPSRIALESFAPVGSFDLTGRIRYEPTVRELTYDLSAQLRDVSLTYRAFPLPVEHACGTLQLTPDRVELLDVSCQRGDTTIRLSGAAGAATQPDDTLTVRCERLKLDTELRSALPAALANLWDRLTPSGSATVEVVVDSSELRGAAASSEALGAPSEARLMPMPKSASVELHHAALGLADVPIELNDITGRIYYGDGALRLEGLLFESAGGRAHLSGMLACLSTGVDGQVSLGVEGLVLDESLRQALPWRWRRLWNDVQPSGRVGASYVGQIRVRSPSDVPGGLPSACLEVGGQSVALDGDVSIATHDVALELGVAVGGLNGRFDGRVYSDAATGDLTLVGPVSVERVRIAGRPVENLRGTLARSSASQLTRLFDLQGDLLGGTLEGAVEWTAEPSPPTYSVIATVRDVALSPLLNVAADAQDAPRDRVVPGTVDAHLFLTGEPGNEAMRRGGGRVEIRDAEFLSLPTPALIVDAANVDAHKRAGRQRVVSDFFVTSGRIQLQNLRLEGDGLVMVGAGDVQWPQQRLDLVLVAGSPRDWPRVPIVSDVVESTSRELMQVEVTGTLSAPHVTKRSLSAVGDVVESLMERRR